MSSNFKNLYTSNNPPLQATLMRGSNIESIHKIHAVITDKKGRVVRGVEVFKIRIHLEIVILKNQNTRQS